MLEKHKLTLPNKFLFEQVLACLVRGKKVTIPVKGVSMMPFLAEGDKVSLNTFQKKDLAKGIIVLAKIGDEMVLHRVVWYNEASIWLAGDGNLAKHEIVNYEDVVAIAVGLQRGRAEVKLNQRWRCQLGQFWYRARPIRRIVSKLF